jgi:hypothetical protein
MGSYASRHPRALAADELLRAALVRRALAKWTHTPGERDEMLARARGHVMAAHRALAGRPA